MFSKKIVKRLVCVTLTLTMAVTQLPGSFVAHAGAEKKEDNTADLRMVFTTDLHGQLTDVDYSTGAVFSKGGLSKAVTLMNEAKKEVGAENTLTFDLGDVMYDYTTDYIYDSDESAIQPIYQAMASVGYDAITLGNHDFEYTLPYIQKQLNDTGLTDKVVVSNVKDANTGASIWNENKIIEKTLTKGNGQTMTVKVGIIGETIPKLSKKRCDYTGVLVGEDIITNVTKETAALKQQGADVIVVLAHSGVGDEYPTTEMAENVAYALTKIDGVDAVLSGHKHAWFCGDGTTKYDSYAGVDPSTGLVNGKNLVMVANSGKGIGVVDLKMSNEDGTNRIVGRKSAIRKTKATTVADEAINNNYMGKWANTFIADSSEILCEMDASTELNNYLGTLEDDGIIQLLNDIGISYAMLYQNTVNTSTKGLPVVSAARYLKYGGGGGDDYYSMDSNFTRSDMFQLTSYRLQWWMYKVTGSQLREWLEWTASAYETAGQDILVDPSKPSSDAAVSSPSGSAVGSDTSGAGALKQAPFSDAAADRTAKTGVSKVSNTLQGILSYKGSEPLQMTLQEEWRTDWSHYYVFDGIEYTIDTSVAPRYNYDGTLINNTNRITRMTRNGQDVKDTDTFLLVANRVASTALPSQFQTESLSHTSTTYSREYVEEYLERESLVGTMKNTQDNNWDVDFPDDYQYVVQTGALADKFVSTKNWITELLDSSEDFYYYRADFSKMDGDDVTGPSLNLKALNDVETNNDVHVAVQATDPSGLYVVKYLQGKYLVNSSAWNDAKTAGGEFVCSENGVYSVMAQDLLGNKTIRYIRIDNINKSILEAPKVDTYTNRKKTITGTAEPDATIYFELQDGKIYKSTVKENGTFSYALPPQKSSAKVFVYVTDSQGRASARTVVTVKRTGPNKPSLDKVVTSSRILTGDLNDENVYPVLIVDDKTAYVPKDATIRELYNKSEIYNDKYTVKDLNITTKENGSFTIELPHLLKAKAKVKLYTLDAIARISLVMSTTVAQVVPAKAVVDEITNKSTKAYVYSEEKCTSAHVKIGKKTYTAKRAKKIASKNMYRYAVKIPRTDSGVKAKIYLKNVKGKSPVLTVTKVKLVPDTPKADKVKAGTKMVTGSVDIVSWAASGSGVTEEETTAENTGTKVFIYINKQKKRTATVYDDGSFEYKAKSKFNKGSKIVIRAKNKKGWSLKRKLTVK